MSSASNKSKVQGILRVDVGKSRRSSSISVDFKDMEPTSPQPSVDRLSVSFVDNDKKLDAPSIIRSSITENDELENGDEEDEYSASANVILERNRDSWKRRSSKRRGSSPFSPPADGARRRSSIFTWSSGETGLSIDDVANQNLRIHKEVVSQIKYQPWPMRRKLRLVHQAKSYIKLHEGQIQERLAQKKSTKDILAHIKIIIANHWNYFSRELTNILNNIIPWESRIKEIESHFGSAVASYFTFHRWLFSVNLKLSMALVILVILPEVFLGTRDTKFSGVRKEMLEEEKSKSNHFLTLWNFEGILKHSPIFYGYYNSKNTENDSIKNELPLIYFLTGLGVYIYSFIAILHKMAKNSRQSKLTEKDEDFIFTWKLFTSWDFMIGNPETAHNRTSSIILGFKEALLEEAEKTREEKRNWKLFSIRIFTHLNVLWLLASSMYAVIYVVGKPKNTETDGWWQQNEVTIVITLIGMIYPFLFDVIGLLEKYHPRKALRLQLARIMVLNLLNLYSFIIATFSNISELSLKSRVLKRGMIEYYCRNISKVVTKVTAASLISNSILLQAPEAIRLMHDPSQISIGYGFSGANQSFPIHNVYDSLYYHQTPFNVDDIEHTKITFDHLPFVNTQAPSPEPAKSTLNYDTPSIKEQYNTLYDFNEIIQSTEADKEITNTSMGLIEYLSEPTENSSDSSLATDYFTETMSLPDMTGSQDIFTVDNNDTSTERQTSITSYSEPTERTMFTNVLDISSTDLSANRTLVNEVYTKKENQNYLTSGRDISTTGITKYETNYKTTPAIYQNVSELPPDVNKHCEILNLSDFSPYARYLRCENKTLIHKQCWETMFGQELVKLTVMDLVMTVMSILMVDFFRALFVRFMNSCWCWDLEKTFPQYGDFKIAENILHLVNNQGMVWMGMFFSPGLPLINILKLVILMYMRSWAVLTCNVPHEVVFRASRSNNFYFALLLIMLFLCVLPVGYALVWIDTSWHCGPFSKYNRIYFLFTMTLKNKLPPSMSHVFDYVASPGIIIPLFVLLILIIYYLISLTSALREANDDLKIQLRRERTEERRKVFQMANKKRKGTDNAESNFNKWCKVINPNLSGKTSIDNAFINIQSESLNSKPSKNPTFKEPDGKFLFRRKTTTKQQSSARSQDSRQNKKNMTGDKQGKVDVLHKESEVNNFKNDPNIEDFREREDSVISGWSIDNIPEIKISESDSLENMLQKSPETCSQSKSSSKETIINIEPPPHTSSPDEVQDDVFIENSYKEDINQKKDDTLKLHHNKEEVRSNDGSSEKQDDTENEESLGLGESYESLPKAIQEMNDMSKIASPQKQDESTETRKTLAKILVEGLKDK